MKTQMMTRRQIIAKVLQVRNISEFLIPLPSWVVNEYDTKEELRRAVLKESGSEVVFIKGKAYTLPDDGPRRAPSWFGQDHADVNGE